MIEEEMIRVPIQNAEEIKEQDSKKGNSNDPNKERKKPGRKKLHSACLLIDDLADNQEPHHNNAKKT